MTRDGPDESGEDEDGAPADDRSDRSDTPAPDDWSRWFDDTTNPTWSSAVPELEFDDGFEEEPTPTAPFPLPPDDRLWRHPSEIKYEGAPDAGGTTTPRAMSVRTGVAVAIAAGTAGALLATFAIVWLAPRTHTVTERVVERQAVASVGFTGSGTGSFVDVAGIAAAVTPAIVRVEVYRSGQPQPISSGSGVLIRDDGHLLTNAHVVDVGDEVRVVLADGAVLDASLVGMDRLTDVAVVRAERSDGIVFPVAVLGATDELLAGEPAIAIGSPLRLQGGPTVTVGVISAVGRRLQAENGEWLYNLVQTDAPISPGSSGGALLDQRGTVIGITTAIAVSDVGAEGLGFATPIEVAKAVADDLIVHGEARHGLIGIRGEDAVPGSLHGVGYDSGVVVREVRPDGPAAGSGLDVGDIVVELDGVPLASMVDLVVRARLLEPGEAADIRVVRDGQLLDLEITAGQLD